MNYYRYIKKTYEGSWLQKIRTKYKQHHLQSSLRKKMNLYGVDLLLELFECFRECNTLCWLEFGTLLGAYRNQTFIPHDCDIDIGMFANDYSINLENALFEHGFIKKRMFKTIEVGTKKETITEIAYTFKGLCVDIFFSYKTDIARNVYVYIRNSEEETLQNIFAINKYTLPIISKLCDVTIDGHTFKAPTDIPNTLNRIYGPNYMIPDPTWVTTEKKENVETLDIKELYGAGVWGLAKKTNGE